MAARTIPQSLLRQSLSSWTTTRWTCRTCLLRPPSTSFTTSRRTIHSYPTRKTQSTFSNAAKPIAQQNEDGAEQGNKDGSGSSKTRRPRRALVATATGAGVLAAMVAVSDDAKHYAEAVQRTGRVVGTLAVCIDELVSTKIIPQKV